MLFLGKLFLGENNANSTFIGIFTFPKTKDLGRKFIPKRFWEIFGRFLGAFLGKSCLKNSEGEYKKMRKKNYKGRCEKRTISKSKDVCRFYDPIQSSFAEILNADPDIEEIRCNVVLDGKDTGEYMTDFLCIKTNGDMLVRECVYRKFLTKPMTVKFLDISKDYWLRHGVEDWGVVIDAE
ncbi:hypothetical protein HMPREF0991_03125 [Lachnospiraceae bacterium 2_1_58FAA]|nr:hypothetical protein HMPREF0991_03125 [Lachnospiraceae bacterium 2_1_58FAA]DAF74351.1 MAG TPA: transposon-encoded protein [Bacteriophage sp.]